MHEPKYIRYFRHIHAIVEVTSIMLCEIIYYLYYACMYVRVTSTKKKRVENIETNNYVKIGDR